MTTAIQISCMVAAFLTLIHSFMTLWRMSPESGNTIRAAFVLLCTGSFGEVVAIAYGYIPGIYETLVMIGVGTLCMCDRRLPHFKKSNTQATL